MGKPRLLDRTREALRVRHYSVRTEEAYLHWVRRYILFHSKRHPAEMGEARREFGDRHRLVMRGLVNERVDGSPRPARPATSTRAPRIFISSD